MSECIDAAVSGILSRRSTHPWRQQLRSYATFANRHATAPDTSRVMSVPITHIQLVRELLLRFKKWVKSLHHYDFVNINVFDFPWWSVLQPKMACSRRLRWLESSSSSCEKLPRSSRVVSCRQLQHLVSQIQDGKLLDSTSCHIAVRSQWILDSSFCIRQLHKWLSVKKHITVS